MWSIGSPPRERSGCSFGVLHSASNPDERSSSIPEPTASQGEA